MSAIKNILIICFLTLQHSLKEITEYLQNEFELVDTFASRRKEIAGNAVFKES